MSSSSSVSSFPFLTGGEFRSACSSLVARVNALPGELTSLGWTSIKYEERDGESILSILKPLDWHPSSGEGGGGLSDDSLQQQEEEYIEDEDPEMLIRKPEHRAEIEYNILLSPTYQVPVLYFFLRNLPHTEQNTLDLIYQHLVPRSYRSDLKDVGVLGGISMANHPLSGIPVYFIHPCNTATALRDVVTPETVPSGEAYLSLWLGIVGNCVGLSMPKELFSV